MKNDSVVWLCFDAEHFEKLAAAELDTATRQGWSVSMQLIMKKQMDLNRSRWPNSNRPCKDNTESD
jgi:hypothetical protein